MLQTIELAVENVEQGRGGPFAALVVKDNRIIATGTNLVTNSNDPTAHAEVVAIRNACRELGSFQLTGCEMYASCEPCPMCLGAIYWARPTRLFFAAGQAAAAAAGFDDSHIYREIATPLSERSLPTQQLALAESGQPFAAWASAVQRVDY